ncbi:MAG TPA: hypothetical protein VEL07_19205 [Planctomycetota bacterium]|nr:hypothetical protein [Planctomycetota bacterium]
MKPYRPLVIDNRPTLPVFLEGSPLSDGMANFASALISAPQQAAAIRAQRERAEVEDLWRQREWDRTVEQDQMARMWGNHDRTQRAQLQQAQIANIQNDNTRAWAGDVAKGIGALFGNKGATAQRGGYSTFTDENGKPFIYDRATGTARPAVPPPAPVAPQPQGPGAIARVMGWFNGGQPAAAPAPAGPTGPGPSPQQRQEISQANAVFGQVAAPAPVPQEVQADINHHANAIASALTSGDRTAAQAWIARMRAEHGDEFTDMVKQAVRAMQAP